MSASRELEASPVRICPHHCLKRRVKLVIEINWPEGISKQSSKAVCHSNRAFIWPSSFGVLDYEICRARRERENRLSSRDIQQLLHRRHVVSDLASNFTIGGVGTRRRPYRPWGYSALLETAPEEWTPALALTPSVTNQHRLGCRQPERSKPARSLRAL